MSDKTKAALPGRQGVNDNLPIDSRLLLGVPKNKPSLKVAVGHKTFVSQFFESALVVYSHTERNRSCLSVLHSESGEEQDLKTTMAMITTPKIKPNFFIVYPFGSMPRCESSRRIILLSHADRVSSPSCCIAFVIASSRLGSTRNAICLFPRGIFVFDMCLTLGVIFVVSRNVHHVSDTCKARSPAVFPAPTGPLTTTDRLRIEAAMKNDTTRPQGRNNYIWRFLALNRHDKKAKPCRLSVEAETEHDASCILAPHFILSLAARLPAVEVLHV